MKSRITMLTAALVWTVFTFAQSVKIDQTNFPDKQFRESLLKQDFGRDGVISASEMSNIKKLDVSAWDINDLTGIHLFTSMKELDCSLNNLRRLDVSKCKALVTLWCQNNQLEEIILNKSKIEWIRAEENQFQTLDISNCPELLTMYCEKNRLVSINASNSPKLRTLHSYNNELTSVNLRGCTALRYFYTECNQLTQLDFSSCADLWEVWCSNNNINGENMDKMLKSLRKVTPEDDCEIFIYDPISNYEGNLCTKSQISIAKSRGWFISKHIGDEKWAPYEGSEPTGIDGVEADNGINENNTTRYNLRGQRVNNNYRGIVIENGKKIIVK